MKNVITLEPEEVNALFIGADFVMDDWYFPKNKLIKVDDILNGSTETIDEDFIEEINEKLDRNDCTAADVIKHSLIEEWGEEPYTALEKLKGFSIKLKQVGEHHHDGQLVDYVIDLVSPNGKKTKITEQMCLVCGFEAQEDVEIAL